MQVSVSAGLSGLWACCDKGCKGCIWAGSSVNGDNLFSNVTGTMSEIKWKKQYGLVHTPSVPAPFQLFRWKWAGLLRHVMQRCATWVTLWPAEQQKILRRVKFDGFALFQLGKLVCISFMNTELKFRLCKTLKALVFADFNSRWIFYVM